MAYSDYGAFVYRNMDRRRDREDGGAFARDADGKDGYGCYHAVLGDGDIRLCIYKTSEANAELMYLPDGSSEPETISVHEYLRTLQDPDKASRKAGDENPDRSGRSYTFDFHGATVTISIDDGRVIQGYARVEQGDVEWQAWYGNGFGAGLTDERYTDKWETLDPDTKAMRPYVEKSFALRSGTVEGKEIAFEGIVGDGQRPIATVWAAPVLCRPKGGEEYWEACLFSSTADEVGASIGPSDMFIALINYGIRLARQGVDQVTWGCSIGNASVPFHEFAGSACRRIGEDRFLDVEEAEGGAG